MLNSIPFFVISPLNKPINELINSLCFIRNRKPKLPVSSEEFNFIKKPFLTAKVFYKYNSFNFSVV